METTGHRLERIIKNLSNLPSLPFIASKISTIAQDKRYAIQDIVDVISIDQSLAAKLLKLVNSSFYGFSTKVTSISRAVSILGFQTIKNLAMGVSIFNTASTLKGSSMVFDMEKFWEHSVAVGAGSKLLARYTGFKDLEEAFLAGLLHDIGKIIFNEYMPREFSEALEAVRRDRISLLEAETKIIRADHEIAGDYLAERWKLPFAIKRSISQHHTVPLNDTSIPPDVLKLICIVNLSNTLCKMKNIGFSGNDRITRKDESVLQVMNIDETGIERFFMELDTELIKAKEFLGIMVSQEDGLSGHEAHARPSIMIIYRDKARILMSFLFISNMGYECQKYPMDVNFEPQFQDNLRVIFTDQLTQEEKSRIAAMLETRGMKIPLLDIPVPFSGDVILKAIEKK